MSLKEYTKIRDFQNTPEPLPTPDAERDKTVESRFVIQKHWASHLHYDFRLETGGVLKSWAIPKGPSMNPSDKRLAIQVEDHPVEYIDFEGEIPEGNYGAGTVEIWDSGTWGPEPEFKDVSGALKNGLLEFYLDGENLKGEFVLTRMKKSSLENEWLLIKKTDNYAVGRKYDANAVKPKSKK